MKISMQCVSVRLQNDGPIPRLYVKLENQSFRAAGGQLEFQIMEPLPEQRAAYVVGDSYDVEFPGPDNICPVCKGDQYVPVTSKVIDIPGTADAKIACEACKNKYGHPTGRRIP